MSRATTLARAARLSAPSIAKLCGGRLLQPGREAQRVATDSRTVRPGDLFVALHGDQHDGHAHVADAVQKGACGALVERPVDGVPAGAFVVLVPDTRKALLELAAEHRRHVTARVVGITGSCGKTSTKDMLGKALTEAMPTVFSEKSFNNEIGVPLTLFAIRPDTRAAVVEVGSNAPGEIERLARVVRPDVAIVTCIAESHLQGLGSVEGVAREKAALVAALRGDGLAVLNGDDPNVAAMQRATTAKKVFVRVDREADWFATDVRFTGLGTTFLLQGKRPVTLPRLGSHNVYNALFTIAAAHALGVEVERTLGALAKIPPSQRRCEHKVVAGVALIDDTYNMNPGSARAALRAIAGLCGQGKKVVVFGEMLELGPRAEELHRALGTDVAASGVDVLVVLGGGATPIAEGALAAGMPASRVLCAGDLGQAQDELLRILKPGDAVLCKASRRIGLDRLVDDLAARLAAARGGAD